MKKILTIAGSDSSGGAGIQADIKTITVHGMYAMSAITALTAQNTVNVQDILTASAAFVGEELDCIFSDIYPDAVKIGMVSNIDVIEMIAGKLQQYPVEHVVIDPVMVSTSGCRLISVEAVDCLIEKLLPLGTLLTPNIPEAEILCGCSIKTEADMLAAANQLGERFPGAVLLKGGHRVQDASDFLFYAGQGQWFHAPRIDTKNTHGTGCTLSSALACNLAAGYSLEDSVRRAKAFLTRALSAGLDLGRGAGPMNHWEGRLQA